MLDYLVICEHVWTEELHPLSLRFHQSNSLSKRLFQMNKRSHRSTLAFAVQTLWGCGASSCMPQLVSIFSHPGQCMDCPISKPSVVFTSERVLQWDSGEVWPAIWSELEYFPTSRSSSTIASPPASLAPKLPLTFFSDSMVG